MDNKPRVILGINPGAKYLGIAVFHDGDLRDWRMKAVKGKWSKAKMLRVQQLISTLIVRYNPQLISLKNLHPSRRSAELSELTEWINVFAHKAGIHVYEYSIKDLETFYSPNEKINKREMAELVASEYPALTGDLMKIPGKKGKKGTADDKYFSRMFEAVALGSILSEQLQ